MITHRYEHGIYAIDAEYHQPLFDAAHLIVEGDRAAFVDSALRIRYHVCAKPWTNSVSHAKTSTGCC